MVTFVKMLLNPIYKQMAPPPKRYDYTWILYMVAIAAVVVAFSYYLFVVKKRRMHRAHRMEEIRRVVERRHQRRRPGATFRDHEIFRNILARTRAYLTVEDEGAQKVMVLRRTRSGTIYASFESPDIEQQPH